MSDIGKQIMKRRIELGMTQEELALKMGYKGKSSINKIEMGINDIPQSKIVQFAEVLNTSIAYLMDWEEEQKNSNTHTDTAAEKELSENMKALIDFAKSVPEDKADLVLRVMKSILEDAK